jgi:LmbE family N-acetylglucosaminyl deacetylase
MHRALQAIAISALSLASAFAQAGIAGLRSAWPAGAEIQQSLSRLEHSTGVLMIGAHPDDENNALLTYLSRGRKVRTAYLSLTRGEGGQNVLGPEQGALLGAIRTQELLGARRLEDTQQYFTRAVDFGFSKTADETLRKWDREGVLRDIVWVIRSFRPDVIVLRFTGTPQDGHGHHQSSAILGKEAFAAAADPQRFPDQLKALKPWHATRVLWNGFAFSQAQKDRLKALPNGLAVQTGDVDPVLGYAYTEIAGMSRSLHRTQAMGEAQARGNAREYLFPVAGSVPHADILEGIDAAAKPAEAEFANHMKRASAAFEPKKPWTIVAQLSQARKLLAPGERRSRLDETIGRCLGLWLDAAADRALAATGSTVRLQLEAISRAPIAVTLERISFSGALPAQEIAVRSLLVDNEPLRRELELTLPPTIPVNRATPDMPEAPPLLTAKFHLRVGDAEIELQRPVEHRYIDNVKGELVRPFVVVPRTSVEITQPVLLFPNQRPRTLSVLVQAYAPEVSGHVELRLPAGWISKPLTQAYALAKEGDRATLNFEVSPGNRATTAEIQAWAGDSNLEVREINYEHIRPQVLLFPAMAKLVRADVQVLSKNIGYVAGAGDEVPDALRQMGCTVSLLDPEQLARGELNQYDAIVTGVRAYNVRPDLRAAHQRLLDYMSQGGTLVAQYNVLDPDPGAIGPYPITIGRQRVSVEEAPVKVLAGTDVLLTGPNAIGDTDFEGWVQERGLYFPLKWDSRYRAVVETSDPGESPLRSGILSVSYGKGTFVYTSYSWFRQLPAGIPGAYRIFANLLSAGKSTNAQRP